jgi:hypothetical protein
MLPSRSSKLLFLLLIIGMALMAEDASGFALSPSSSSTTGNTILVVGATGGTGQRAIQGLLDVLMADENSIAFQQTIRLLSRNTTKLEPLLQRRQSQSSSFGNNHVILTACQADLNVYDEALVDACRGCTACYVHSTSSDTAALDTGEVRRAQNLARAIQETASDDSSIQTVVYNSAAGEVNHGVGRIAQKWDVENVFVQASSQSQSPQQQQQSFQFISLRANLFMEELWKSYTRPAILKKGKFPFGVPADRHLYLTAVRDMGRLAAACCLRRQSAAGTSTSTNNKPRIINVVRRALGCCCCCCMWVSWTHSLQN